MKQTIYRHVEMLITACFYYMGLVKLTRWWTRRFAQHLVILCYHHASGGDLRRHLLYLRRHYRLLHLEAALEELYASPKDRLQWKDRRTPLALTFDDGYHDNYTHAFALARELQVPITIFLVPGYIESRSRFWWQESEYLVDQALVCEATIEGQTYHLNRLTERKALAQMIDARVRYSTSVAEREEFLVSIRKTLAVPIAVSAEEQTTLPLTWAEVQDMEASGWISFGAHTMHHPILAYMADPTEVQYEVRECREVLEQHLGHPVRSFAYPVGQLEHIGAMGLHAVRDAKYDWAVTAIQGFNVPQTAPHLLRRVVVDVDHHWLTVAAKASGVWGIFSRLCKMPVTLIQSYLWDNRQK